MLKTLARGSCDLLSNQYFWTIENSNVGTGTALLTVVICFQISIFGPLKTAIWQRQLFPFRCDLLSNQYFWTIENSFLSSTYISQLVVICFQISIFGPLKTAPILDYVTSGGCDLLSNQYFWTIENSRKVICPLAVTVVICFQISIFGPLKTAMVPSGASTPWL